MRVSRDDQHFSLLNDLYRAAHWVESVAFAEASGARRNEAAGERAELIEIYDTALRQKRDLMMQMIASGS